MGLEQITRKNAHYFLLYRYSRKMQEKLSWVIRLGAKGYEIFRDAKVVQRNGKRTWKEYFKK